MAKTSSKTDTVVLPSIDDVKRQLPSIPTRRSRRLDSLTKKVAAMKPLRQSTTEGSPPITHGVFAQNFLPRINNEATNQPTVSQLGHSLPFGSRHPSAKSHGKTKCSNLVSAVMDPSASKVRHQTLHGNVRPGFQPLKKFRETVRRVQLLNSVAAGRSRNATFTQYLDMTGSAKATRFRDLTFDPLWFASPRESRISSEAASALSLEPGERTAQQRHAALVSLRTTLKEFSEFPLGMQESLVTVGVYHSYERNRVIIRQGHFARNFYMVLSGVVAVVVFRADTGADDTVGNLVAFLGKGSSFGEVAIMQNTRRTATVVCKDDVELLALERDDFVDIFMHQESGVAPEFIRFLQTVDDLCGWPVNRLPWNDPSTCLLTYFRRGFVICKDTSTSKWIYVVKTGSCRLLKKLQAPATDFSVLTGTRTYTDIAQDSKETVLSSRRRLRRRTMPRPKNAAGAVSSSSTVSIKRPPRKTSSPGPADGLDIMQHQRAIGRVFRRLVSQQSHGYLSAAARDSGTTSKRKQQKHVFIQLHTLGPKSVIGLEQVAFSDQGSGISLVSEGTETVLINKAFFVGNLSGAVLKDLRSTIRPYPSEASLQQQLQETANWKAFKMLLVSDYATRTRRSLKAAAVRC